MGFKIMRIHVLLLSIAIFLLSVSLSAQSLNSKKADQFIWAMINNQDSLESFVFPEELSISKRLGITYDGVKNKFLISYEIPDEIIKEIKSKKTDYKVNVENLQDDYSILHFEVPSKNYKTQFYFKNDYLISPPYYYFKDWPKTESDHFIFYVSEPEYFNQYSIDKLEDFISNVFTLMEYTEEEKETITNNKIIYILCKHEDEIEKLTGYKARGMSNLAFDYLITTYNCHYHELVHLLINFKLKMLPLYTHPFLQEGLAVALGGRGGKEPDVILNLGHFISESGFMNYTELFDANNFKNHDASMSYPLSGLYNQFLLSSNTFDNYIKFYRKYSSSDVSQLIISPDDLPDKTEWENFLNKDTINSVNVDFNEKDFKLLAENDFYHLKENDDYYLVGLKGNLLISTPDKPENYKSKIFQEFFPDIKYQGEKYLIRINEGEIAIYNLCINNLVANYVSSFTLAMKPVPNENDFYKFCIKKNIFDENWKNWQIINLEDEKE